MVRLACTLGNDVLKCVGETSLYMESFNLATCAFASATKGSGRRAFKVSSPNSIPLI
jgi:hypothetical protein